MDIRRREPGDLGACVRVLAEVHRADGCPVDWPERPADWLSPPALLDAWVAAGQGEPAAGHITLSAAESGDAAPGLWSRRTGAPARAMRAAGERGLHPVLDVLACDTAAAALYERLGWSLLGTVGQRWSASRTVTVRCYAAPA